MMEFAMKPTTVTLCGIPFLPLTRKEAYARLARLALGKRTAKVFTPNLELLSLARGDASFADLLGCADLLLPDGVGVLLAARLVGKRLPVRLTGIDSAEWLLSFAERRGLRVFLLGGKHGVAETAARELREKHPKLTLCGTHHGYFDKAKDSSENIAVLEAIRQANPHLLFVCFGAPAQERWICENIDALPSLRLAIGLGGALDVWSGNVRRAPKVFQRCGLEWLWRIAREPRRIKRFLHVLPFRR